MANIQFNKKGFKIYEIVDGVQHKRCSKCNELIPLTTDFFSGMRKAMNGFQPACKKCNSILPPFYDNGGNMICNTCKEYKPLNEFFRNGAHITGIRKGYEHNCKKCSTIRKETLRTVPEKGLKHLISKIYNMTRRTSIKKNYSCDITKEFLLDLWNKQEGICAISGIKMTTLQGKGRVLTNLSIDRIDSSIGYNKDNVQFTCDIVNIMKFNQTMGDFIAVCNKIVNYQINKINKEI